MAYLVWSPRPSFLSGLNHSASQTFHIRADTFVDLSSKSIKRRQRDAPVISKVQRNYVLPPVYNILILMIRISYYHHAGLLPVRKQNDKVASGVLWWQLIFLGTWIFRSLAPRIVETGSTTFPRALQGVMIGSHAYIYPLVPRPMYFTFCL